MRPTSRTRADYSLLHLLRSQPKTVQRSAGFDTLLHHVNRSPRLQRLRINRRCYRLLDTARIADGNLANFHRTYRLPKDSFFREFIRLKRRYLDHRALLKKRREEYIQQRVKSLDSRILEFLLILGRHEKQLNHADRTPVWEKTLYPATKKLADAYHDYTIEQWSELAEQFGTALQQRYHRSTVEHWNYILAAFLLEALPADGSFRLPNSTTVRRQYRKLSKRHHPDQGGDPEQFRRLKEAFELLRDAVF